MRHDERGEKMNSIPRVTFNDGKSMPQLGLGVFDISDGDEVRKAVTFALEEGYRSIDTASVYGNEKGVGQAIRESGIPREEVFLTTKVWNNEQGYESTLEAFQRSLEKLGLDYVDLYLIHWAVEAKYRDTWRGMEKLQDDGLIRSIGVSNFQIRHLKGLFQSSETKPVLNQVELHPYLQQEELHTFCLRQDVFLEAWSPLSRGLAFKEPLIMELASKYGKTAAQIILRWEIQRGIISIPKSSKPARIRENSAIFDFALEQEEMVRMKNLDRNYRIGADPDNFRF
jgi:methylglyoxal/glyoxal reductase